MTGVNGRDRTSCPTSNLLSRGDRNSCSNHSLADDPEIFSSNNRTLHPEQQKGKLHVHGIIHCSRMQNENIGGFFSNHKSQILQFIQSFSIIQQLKLDAEEYKNQRQHRLLVSNFVRGHIIEANIYFFELQNGK